jgi:hypothetical protein
VKPNGRRRFNRRLAVAFVVAIVCALVAGGVGTGLALAQQARMTAVGSPRSAPARAAAQSPLRVAVKRALAGRIVSIDGDRLVVRDAKSQRQIVLLTDATKIRRRAKATDRAALVPGAAIAVLGAPGPEGALVARLVSVTADPPRRAP